MIVQNWNRMGGRRLQACSLWHRERRSIRKHQTRTEHGWACQVGWMAHEVHLRALCIMVGGLCWVEESTSFRPPRSAPGFDMVSVGMASSRRLTLTA